MGCGSLTTEPRSRPFLGSERLIGARATGVLLIALLVVFALVALVLLGLTHALTPHTHEASGWLLLAGR